MKELCELENNYEVDSAVGLLDPTGADGSTS